MVVDALRRQSRGKIGDKVSCRSDADVDVAFEFIEVRGRHQWAEVGVRGCRGHAASGRP